MQQQQEKSLKVDLRGRARVNSAYKTRAKFAVVIWFDLMCTVHTIGNWQLAIAIGKSMMFVAVIATLLDPMLVAAINALIATSI